MIAYQQGETVIEECYLYNKQNTPTDADTVVITVKDTQGELVFANAFYAPTITADVAAGSLTVDITDGSGFNTDEWAMINDGTNSEYIQIESVAGNTLTFYTALVNSYIIGDAVEKMIKMDEVAMTHDALGEYHYDYDLPDDALVGMWKIIVKATLAGVDKVRNDSFRVVL